MSEQENNTIFGKILRGEIPADLIHEDEKCIAFRDVSPQAPNHILLIPRKLIPKLSDAVAEDKEILGHMMVTAGDIARKLGFEDAFRLVINNGSKAQQTVFHLHMHILSGRSFNWPPG
ncbi:MAG: histidine triad nucleotide-binding protein [Lentisphaeraceae bacterium]|nr:histidine triad nucleotide-binding protein [Lentisphaeraceae bacterium]